MSQHKTFKEEVEEILRNPLLGKRYNGDVYNLISEDADAIVNLLKQKILEALPKEINGETSDYQHGFDKCIGEVKQIIGNI